MIYSRYLFAGVYPLMAALEEAGFNRKLEKNMIKFSISIRIVPTRELGSLRNWRGVPKLIS